MKTSELIGLPLDRAVARAKGYTTSTLDLLFDVKNYSEYNPSTDWAHGGPLIDEIEGFALKVWLESSADTKYEAHIHNYDVDAVAFGPTALVATMRCYVESLLGDFIDDPEITGGQNT